MGKGKMGCAPAMPEIEQDAEFLAMRQAFAPVLRERMEELVDQANLLGRATVQLALDAMVSQYERGTGGPDEWMDNYLGRFRLILSGQMHAEDDAMAAAACLASEDLPPESAIEGLKSHEALADTPAARSAFRLTRANIHYREGQIAEALACLEEELYDSGLPATHRRAAQLKIEALEGLAEPSGWEEELIPPEFREGDGERPWAQMTGEGLGGREGSTAGHWFARQLARHGHLRRALRLCDRLIAHQEEEESARSLKASVMKGGGWPDRAAWSLPAGSHVRLKTFEAYGMTGQIASDLRERKKHTEDSEYQRTHRQLVRLLVSEGRIDEALAEAQGPHPEGTLMPVAASIEVYEEAASAAKDKSLYREERKRLVESPEFLEEEKAWERQFKAHQDTTSERALERIAAVRRLAGLPK